MRGSFDSRNNAPTGWRRLTIFFFGNVLLTRDAGRRGRGAADQVPERARCSSGSSRTVIFRSLRAVRWRAPSVPLRPSMYARISGASRRRPRSWLTRARVTPYRRASSAAFFASPAAIIRCHTRARPRSSMILGRSARSARARGPQAWPAASGDGPQPICPAFARGCGWPALLLGRGPLERGPSSGCRGKAPRGLCERRGPPARCPTGRAGCVSLPGSGMFTDQPVRTPVRSVWTKLAPQVRLELTTLRLTEGCPYCYIES